MTVSLTWLALFLVLGIFLFLGLRAKGVYDAFQNYTKEGFTVSTSQVSDIQITTCPAGLTNFIDTDGMSMCCEGDILDGKCSGETRCTLSESSKGIATCSTWYSAFLKNKSIDRCPPSMPNYFEGGEKGRGCTAGRRSADGKGPMDSTIKFCTLYDKEEEERNKVDSCSNQKLLDEAVAFPGKSIAVQYSLVSWSPSMPAVIQASFIDGNSPTTCFTNSSLERFYDQQQGSSWRDSFTGWNIDSKLNFCSVIEKYKIDKTITANDISYINYRGEGRAPVQAPALPANTSICSGTCPKVMRANNARCSLEIQEDGNMVIYTSAREAVWSTKTQGTGAGNTLSMQNDGNLVLYSPSGKALWSSGTSGKGTSPFKLVIQDDCNLVIYDKNNKATWSSGTTRS